MYLFLICILLFALAQSVHKPTNSIWALTKERCDILKAVLPVLIIIHHHCMASHYPPGVNEDFLIAGAAVVWLFFAISGYGLTYSRHRNKLHNKSLAQRVWGLYMPTIIPVCIYLITLIIYSGDILKSVEKCFRNGYFPLPFAWFILSLALQYIAFYASDRLFSSRRGFNLSLCAFTAAIMVASRLLGTPDYFYSSNIGFLVGVFYCEYEPKVLLFLKGKAKYVFGIVLIVNAALCVWGIMKYNMVLKGVWILSLLAVLPFVELKMMKVTKFLSKISYEIYLCQGAAFVIILPLKLPAGVSLLLIVGLSILFAYISQLMTNYVIGKFPSKKKYVKQSQS